MVAGAETTEGGDGELGGGGDRRRGGREVLGPPLLVDAGASSGTKTSTLWMLPPREAMQSEIRDGELRAEGGVSPPAPAA